MTAAEILAVTTPEGLFTSPNEVDKEYHQLAKLWHPDVCKDPKATEVFAHIDSMRGKALEKIKLDVWGSKAFKKLTGLDKGSIIIRYKKLFDFELGEMMIADRYLFYHITKQYKNVVTQFLNAKFKYPSTNKEEEFRQYLPINQQVRNLEDGSALILVPKNHDIILLKDLIEYNKTNPIPEWPRHVAWIMSTLHNMCCYLSWAQITHNAIMTSSYYICPEFHSGALLGHWFFWATAGSRMRMLPKETYSLMLDKKDKAANYSLDLNSIRAIGRAALTPDTPKPMREWFIHPSSGNAFKDYTAWDSVLQKSFGKKKFVKLEVTAKQIYG